MNLFCFSLEGSTDSLYEPVPEQQANQQSTLCRTGSPSSPFGESGQAPSHLSVEFSNLGKAKPKKQKSMQRSVSENKGFDLNEDGFLLGDNINTPQGKKLQGMSCQRVTSECSHPCQYHRHVKTTANEMTIKSSGDPVGSVGTLNRLQKLVWTKKVNGQSQEDVKPATINVQDEDDTPISCMKLTKSQQKKVSKASTKKKENMETRLHSISASHCGSSNSKTFDLEDMYYEDGDQMWNSWKTFPENPYWTCIDFQISQVGPWVNCPRCTHHPLLKPSHTDMDLPHSWRSSSFGNFDRFRNNFTPKLNDSTEVSDGEATHENEEHNKTSNNEGRLSKRVRAISWTMKKKMGKKYIKALSEDKGDEDGEDVSSYRNSDPVIGGHTEKVSLKASDSMDSLYSGQSSSSGITSCSDGTSNRDSFRLDDEGPYTGPFCGRARVHTDFTPSPYDTDSLKIKRGDVIDIICKTPMGMWTGMLNNKVGNFKFIYVDVISEEEVAPKKIKPHRRSKCEKQKTLQEFLEKIHLQEYTSTLLLNGYETLEDLKDIKESHLIELNIENPEDRARLLSAAENLFDEETILEQENEPAPLSLSPNNSLSKTQLDDCPRDSGCYISSENSDNGKEELESDTLPNMIQKMTITRSGD